MINFENRYDAYAYRVAGSPAASSVTSLTEGQWVQYNASGELAIADGTTQQAFLCYTSKRDGRDNVTPQKPYVKLTYLDGPWQLTLTNDTTSSAFLATGTYAPGTALTIKVANPGILQPAETGDKIFAYAMSAVSGSSLRVRNA